MRVPLPDLGRFQHLPAGEIGHQLVQGEKPELALRLLAPVSPALDVMAGGEDADPADPSGSHGGEQLAETGVPVPAKELDGVDRQHQVEAMGRKVASKILADDLPLEPARA